MGVKGKNSGYKFIYELFIKGGSIYFNYKPSSSMISPLLGQNS